MIEKEIITALKNLSVLPSGSIDFGRVLKRTLPPYAEVDKNSSNRPFTHDGDDGTIISVFQVRVYDKDYKGCKVLANGLIALTSYTSSTVAKIALQNETDLYDNTTELFEVSLNFSVRHYKEEN